MNVSLLYCVTLVPSLVYTSYSGIDSDLSISHTGSPYCGIYAMYAALKVQGIQVDFADLIQKRYLGSFSGSSAEELIRAGVDHGAAVTPLASLSAASLRAAQDPIILHVRRPGYGMPYHHWIVFLGWDQGQVRVIDPPGAVELYQPADLLALWDGIGLVVTPSPHCGIIYHMTSIMEMGVATILTLCVYLLLRKAFRPALLQSEISWARQALCLSLSAAICAGAWHALHPDGFLGNPSSLGLVAEQYYQPSVPEIDYQQMQQYVASRNVTIIDCRLPIDYAMGHISSAVSLPVTAGLRERERCLDGLANDRPIVVYCLSDHCSWSDSVAAYLVIRGHTRTSIYRGGYAEWIKHAFHHQD